MKKTNANREILLQCSSKFFQKDWCELNAGKNDKKLSQKEQLIQLCWNGMLKEMIPEVFEPETGEKPLTLWEINESGNMLDLRYGDIDQVIDDEYSINPYVIMELAEMN
ncbi:MAG: hypothetical protein ABIN74_08180 [Ferruginibacter sp.]